MEVVKSKKLPIIALLTALSLIAFLIESLLPPLFVPGAKIGLGNVFLMLCLIWFSLPEALILLAAKVVLSAIFGGASQILYSAPAGIVSLLTAFVLIKLAGGRFGVLSVCALSAVFHNLVQLAVFGLFTRSDVTFYFAPLSVSGLVAGLITGCATVLIIKHFPLAILRKKE